MLMAHQSERSTDIWRVTTHRKLVHRSLIIGRMLTIGRSSCRELTLTRSFSRCIPRAALRLAPARSSRRGAAAGVWSSARRVAVYGCECAVLWRNALAGLFAAVLLEVASTVCRRHEIFYDLPDHLWPSRRCRFSSLDLHLVVIVLLGRSYRHAQ